MDNSQKYYEEYYKEMEVFAKKHKEAVDAGERDAARGVLDRAYVFAYCQYRLVGADLRFLQDMINDSMISSDVKAVFRNLAEKCSSYRARHVQELESLASQCFADAWDS